MEEIRNPYAAPSAPLIPDIPPLPSAVRHELAGRGRRLAARIIDQLLYVACFLPFLVLALMRPGAGFEGAAGLGLVLSLAAMLALFAYNLVLLAQSGQTVAKRWLGIRIVRRDGSEADMGRIFGLRMFLPWLISAFAGPFFSLPDALCIFGEERRCLHDMMADTIVVVA